MAARVAVMYLGRIVEMAPTEDLFERPTHPYTRMLIDALPDIGMSGRARKSVQGEIPNPIHPPPGCAFHPRCPHAFEPCPIDVPALIVRNGHAAACHAVAAGRI
jgi:peptide/nickel transport system ATP-binding protein